MPAHPGFPIAELHEDGSAIITKHDQTGGAVTVGTVTAQLLYEIGGARYAGPDVTARFDTIELTPDGVDRVRVSGVLGEAPPPTLKVGLNRLGGFRNEMTFVLTGLDIAAKARLVQQQLAHLDATWTLARTDHADSPGQEEAAALLHCVVRGPDPKALGRAFSSAAIELALASYPGFHVTSPPGDASPYGVFDAASVEAGLVPHVAVHADGTRVDIAPAPEFRELEPIAEAATPEPVVRPTRAVPLGTIVGARSGDKGGNANVGCVGAHRRAIRVAEQHAHGQQAAGTAAGDGRADCHPLRPAEPARVELRHRGDPRRRGRLERAARSAGQGAR